MNFYTKSEVATGDVWLTPCTVDVNLQVFLRTKPSPAVGHITDKSTSTTHLSASYICLNKTPVICTNFVPLSIHVQFKKTLVKVGLSINPQCSFLQSCRGIAVNSLTNKVAEHV